MCYIKMKSARISMFILPQKTNKQTNKQNNKNLNKILLFF